MAIPYVSKDYTVGMAIQSTWGTAVADNAAVIQLDLVEAVNITQPANRRTNPGATGARWKVTGDYAVDQYGVITEFTVKGDAKQDELDIFLYAWAQKVVEGATTPYSKVFTFDTSAPQPDFAADAGFKLTFFFRDPVAADSWKIKDCICKQLKITAQPGQRVQYEAMMVGRGAPAASTPSGTWTRTANSAYFWDLIARKTVDFGSGAVAQILGSGGITLDLVQTVEKYGQESSGVFTGYTLLDRFPKFSINCLKSDSLASAITAFKASTACTFVIGIGNVTAGTDDGDLDFTFTGILDDPERVFGSHYEFNLTGEMAAANSSTTPLTITLANATDRSF
jgi:hypothetical protein